MSNKVRSRTISNVIFHPRAEWVDNAVTNDRRLFLFKNSTNFSKLRRGVEQGVVKKPRKPKAIGTSKAKHTIEAGLIADMDSTFDNTTKLVSLIAGSHQTWGNITSGVGVRHRKAENVVEKYFELIRGVTESSRASDGVRPQVCKDKYAKYKDRIKDHNYKQFLVPATGVKSDIVSEGAAKPA